MTEVGWRRRWRVHAPRMVFESVLIVASILLALAVDEWRQERKTAAAVAEARAAFAEELRQNVTLLRTDRYLPRRERMLALYRDLAQVDSPTPDALAAIWREVGDTGMHPTPLRDAVWRSLHASEVMGRFPFEDRFVLADIYREQLLIDRWHDRMFDAWMQVRTDRDHPAYLHDSIRRTRSYLADVVAAEHRLIVLYERALERFEP